MSDTASPRTVDLYNSASCSIGDDLVYSVRWARNLDQIGRELLAKTLESILSQIDRKGGKAKPRIVCLCGSTRFSDAWVRARFDLTLAGEIVLTIGCDTKSDEGLGITEEQKVALDELHKRKIDLADYVLVLNVGGYVGPSTVSEIEYAARLGKQVLYLERENASSNNR